MPDRGAKYPIKCILGKPRNYKSMSFRDLARELINCYQFPLVKTIDSSFADTPLRFFGVFFCREDSWV